MISQIKVHFELEKLKEEDIRAYELEKTGDVFINLGNDFSLFLNAEQAEMLHQKLESVLFEESYKDLLVTIRELEEQIKQLEEKRGERIA